MSENYKATKGQVGPFPKGHTFSREEFDKLHPAPAGEDQQRYSQGLIDRLVGLGAIAPSEDEPQVTPPGPETRPNPNAEANRPAPATTPVAAKTIPAKADATPARK